MGGLLFVLFSAEASQCGTIRASLFQKSLSSDPLVEARWEVPSSLPEGGSVMLLEWAAVSEGKVTNGDSCRAVPGFAGLPDVLAWTRMEGRTKYQVNFPSRATETFVVVLRVTTDSGKQFYVNSGRLNNADAVLIIKENGPKKLVKEAIVVGDREVFDCPIDQANRCAASKISVREKLDELYGAPQYGLIAGFVAVPLVGAVNDDDENTDDDDDDIGPGGAFGIAVFFCLLAIGFIVIASTFSKKGSEFQTTVR